MEEKTKQSSTSPDKVTLPLAFLVIGGVVLLAVFWFGYGSATNSGGSASQPSSSAVSEFEAGNSHFQSGQLDQAIEAYRRAIEADPSYQAAYVNLGVAYYQSEQFQLAEAQYRKALELNPNDGEVAYNLGALYLQQALLSGNPADEEAFDRAIRQLEQASTLAPNLSEPFFSLGVAYRSTAQEDEAIEAFEEFLRRNPADQRAVQEAQRYLNELTSQP